MKRRITDMPAEVRISAEKVRLWGLMVRPGHRDLSDTKKLVAAGLEPRGVVVLH